MIDAVSRYVCQGRAQREWWLVLYRAPRDHLPIGASLRCPLTAPLASHPLLRP
jgi:hypothetical protein